QIVPAARIADAGPRRRNAAHTGPCASRGSARTTGPALRDLVPGVAWDESSAARPNISGPHVACIAITPVCHRSARMHKIHLEAETRAALQGSTHGATTRKR